MSVVSPIVNVTIHSAPTPILTLGVDKTSGYPGDAFNFTGNFAQNGVPVAGETVTLYLNTVSVGSSVTDSYGDYLISWIANVEGALKFHMEAAIPLMPPILSRVIGVGVGLVEPSLLRRLAPQLLFLGIGAVVIGVSVRNK